MLLITLIMRVQTSEMLRSWTSIILFNEQMKGDVLEFLTCYLSAGDSIDQLDPQSLKIVAEAVVDLLKTLDRQ
ncbi:hypothetical protein AY608_04915 [Acinetobacter terrae]|jgi:aminopeptidase S|nr:hypothetical protein AY608_04915 [Acinetobacter terrae]